MQLRDLGLAGLGGAVFPSDIKLNPGPSRSPTLIINGGECEPWITCDDLLMRERADEILQGAAVMRHMLGSDRSPGRHRGQQARSHRRDAGRGAKPGRSPWK